MAVATGAKSFQMIGLEQRLPDRQVGAPYVVTAKKAKGTITCVAKANLVDGETVTIGDGTNTKVFEFDVNGTGVTAGRVQVNVSAASTAADVAALLHAAINGVTTGLLVTSVDNLDGTLDLVADVAGAAGNVSITDTVANAGFSVTGMAGGVDTNFGLSQVLVRPGGGAMRKPIWGENDELTGHLEPPEKSLLGWEYSVDDPEWLRMGTLILKLSSMLGEPTVTQDGSSSAWQYDFALTDDPDSAVSLFRLMHKAGSTYPVIVRGVRYGEVTIEAPERGECGIKAKAIGCGWSEHGIGQQDDANTGTNPCGFFTTGPRTDTNPWTDALKFKVSRTVAGGGLRVKVALGVGAYSTVELDIPTDSTTGFQTDWIEVVDDAGPLGLDDCEDGLEPLLVFFSGDLRLYALDDILTAPALVQIPGDASGETGLARSVLAGPRFGPAHFSVSYGTGSTADTALLFEVGNVKLSRTLTPAIGHGRNSRNPYDVDVTGFVDLEATITRRLDSSAWERFMSMSQRLAGELAFEGCTISGSTSGWKESLVITVPQFRLDDVQSPIANAGNIKETLKLVLERARSGDAPTIRVRTATHVDFSRC